MDWQQSVYEQFVLNDVNHILRFFPPLTPPLFWPTVPPVIGTIKFDGGGDFGENGGSEPESGGESDDIAVSL
ncbi:hypothetical protein DERP_011707 [Dermatophagoides pteronyssinus]|uniref:Uncharacterized protein n=1 Tax=Dermatophagoides pteronyssinus TaxID=6956 RepID=A0ABQ8J349_DERPT|nr:hypothetical protein DERP_011707 [Dermatophagoides pteronyssinus]